MIISLSVMRAFVNYSKGPEKIPPAKKLSLVAEKSSSMALLLAQMKRSPIPRVEKVYRHAVPGGLPAQPLVPTKWVKSLSSLKKFIYFILHRSAYQRLEILYQQLCTDNFARNRAGSLSGANAIKIFWQTLRFLNSRTGGLKCSGFTPSGRRHIFSNLSAQPHSNFKNNILAQVLILC